MTATGLTLASPKIGQTITFLKTAQDTDGGELVIEARMRPGAFIPGHRHLRQEETFEVLAGTGTFSVASRKIVATAGEHVRIAAGVAHRFRPALRTEELFEQLFRLGAQGKVNKLGAPGPFTTMQLIRQFRTEFFYLAGVPVWLQRLLAGARP